jgi:hypothetical protein
MIILRNKMTGLILPGRFPAMCIWPFLIIRPEKEIPSISEILNHERMHGRQQLEMAWIFFFLWYMIEFFIRLLIYRDSLRAYRSLAHEREAYSNDSDPEYYKTRKLYSWIKYLHNTTKN